MPTPYRSTHNLFADPTGGEGVVVETIGGKTTVTEVETRFSGYDKLPGTGDSPAKKL